MVGRRRWETEDKLQRAEPVHDKPCKNVRSDVEITSGDCRPILTASFSTRLTALSTFNRAAQTKPIMALTLSVTYNLHPPPDTSAPAGLQPSQTLQTILPDPASVGQKSYYEELRKAVLQTKSALGESLTAWRDAVGRSEDNKEAKVPKKSEDDEEEEEEEDAEA